MLQARNSQDRRVFRDTLVESILNCDPVRGFGNTEQLQLLDQLSRSWTAVENTPDTDRIRSLKKVASDSRRLSQALARLADVDSVLMNDAYQHTVSLPARLTMLREMATDADSMVTNLQGEQRAMQQFQQGNAGPQLIKVLELHGIPIATRNDHEKRPVAEGTGISKSKRNYDFLPSLDCGVTLAMRSAMFAMFDAGVNELDWSRAVASIKAGSNFQEAWLSVDQETKNTSSALLRAVIAARHVVSDMAGIEPSEVLSEACESNLHGPH